MTIASRTGVLGGTFDPIHLGHLAVAHAATHALALARVLLLPSRLPPHRPVDASASPDDRFAMVTLAAKTDEHLVPSDLELRRTGPSYTADTLRALHAAGYDRWQLFFLTGADAFAEIAMWREYPAVLDLAHFVVCARPGTPVTTLRGRLPGLAARMCLLGAAGEVADDETRTRVFLLDSPTPDVSSTEIRARARAGRPLAGLVPPEVDSYIRRHGLYGAHPDAAASGSPAAGTLHE
ncbi:MAG: nicotinate-nucleotide adenylyltransferase [Acidobacteria bacterium]|nr:nicotinate-nucleotide adenylyltransferase [Acidobacteriota bacterium]